MCPLSCGLSSFNTVFSPGNSYQMQISYKPKSDVKTMSAYLYGVIAGIPVPFPLPQP